MNFYKALSNNYSDVIIKISRREDSFFDTVRKLSSDEFFFFLSSGTFFDLFFLFYSRRSITSITANRRFQQRINKA